MCEPIFSLQSVSVLSSKSSVFGFKVFLLRFYEIFIIMTGKETCYTSRYYLFCTNIKIQWEDVGSRGGWGGVLINLRLGKVKT